MSGFLTHLKGQWKMRLKMNKATRRYKSWFLYLGQISNGLFVEE